MPQKTIPSTWQVYLIRCGDGTIYTGSSNNLTKRLDTHNAGKGAKYTRCRLPVSLIYSECCDDKSTALKREIEIKKLTRVQKLSLTVVR